MVVQIIIAAVAAVFAGSAGIYARRRIQKQQPAQSEAIPAAASAAAEPVDTSQDITSPSHTKDPLPVGRTVTAGRIRKPGEPRQILIVDDQPAIRMLLVEVFRTAGFVVHESATGRGAVELAAQHAFDAALLDLQMPDMDGIEVLESIRRIDESVRIIMISGYGDGDKIEEARRAGVEKFFTKPFDIEKLRDYVLEATQ